MHSPTNTLISDFWPPELRRKSQKRDGHGYQEEAFSTLLSNNISLVSEGEKLKI